MSLEILSWSGFLKKPTECAVTIGVFDGIHSGHRELISRIVRRGPNPTLITFRENPKKLLSPESFEGEIFSEAQKFNAFEELSLARIVLIDFSEEFSKMEGREFVRLLRDPGKMTYLALGGNFRCGRDRDLDAEAIKGINEKNGIPTEIIPPVSLGGKIVSSSRVRAAILSGDLKQAELLTGRSFSLDLRGINAEEFPGQDGGFCRDPMPLKRILPPDGDYPVLLHPGEIKCKVRIEKGKVFLPGSFGQGTVDIIDFI